VSISSGETLIVMVEDNPSDIWLVRETLQANEINSVLETYETGEGVLRALANRNSVDLPHLVLLDWNLPIINGAEVLSTLRGWPQFQNTPIAVLTSSGALRDRSQALKLGATRYIEKPMNLDEFLQEVGAEIRALLDSSQQRFCYS
jgi:CheY-like chemotaxis protein